MQKDLESWQKVQGYIVSGGGSLVKNSSLYTDFLPSDLPHYLINNNASHETFRRWKDANRRSFSIIGCWSRPIFAGGWQESSLHDTAAFNLQTPSLFIDMRFPLRRPSQELALKKSLSDCSALDLRLLARQHCFTGYSLPEILPPQQYALNQGKYPVFTRHHVVDWNYLPQFPRNRPNRWWVEVEESDTDGPTSFKEHSIIRDRDTNVPVYFERWMRIAPYSHQKLKYFAARKVRKSRLDRDAVLIVVGGHFALVVDRDIETATAKFKSNEQALNHLRTHCGGGGAFFVDYLLDSEFHDAETLRVHMDLARQYLDLEGSYGLVHNSEISRSSSVKSESWTIHKSTHPWKEGSQLFDHGQSIHFEFSSLAAQEIPKKMTWMGANGTRSHCYGDWEVFECSFPREELQQLFPTTQQVSVPRYLSLFSKL